MTCIFGVPVVILLFSLLGFTGRFGLHSARLLSARLTGSCYCGFISRRPIRAPGLACNHPWAFSTAEQFRLCKSQQKEFGLFVVTMPVRSRPGARCFDFPEQSTFAINGGPVLLGLAAPLFPNFWKAWTRSKVFSWSWRVHTVLCESHIVFIMT